jgi:hypothetical protein
LLRYASRIGVRFGAIIAVTVTLLLMLVNPEGRQHASLSTAWPFIVTAGILFALNTFVITLCGNAVMMNIVWEEGRMRLRRKGTVGLCVLAVGLTVGLSELVVWFGTENGFGTTDAATLFLEVSLFSVVSFSAVVGLMAYDQRGLSAWSELTVE